MTPGDPQGVWGPVRLQRGRRWSGRFGALVIRLKKERNDWLMRIEREGTERTDTSAEWADDDTVEENWSRIGSEADLGDFVIKAALPDRPVVVRPEIPFTILSGGKVQFFVGIPLWIQIAIDGSKSILVHEEPVTILSKTWFGTPFEGELCYALRTRATRTPEELPPWESMAICPVRVRNDAPKPLHFERFCLRVQSLSLFEGKRHLMTNEAGVTYRGEGQPGRVVYGKRPPALDREVKKIADPRKEPERGFFARSIQQVDSVSELFI